MRQSAQPRRTLWHGIALALLLATAIPAPAGAARWFDNLPADDPDTVPPRRTAAPAEEAPAAAPLPQLTAGMVGLAGGVLSGAYGAASSVVWTAVAGGQAIAGATSEALWETAYMFGSNRTPVPRPNIVDPVADLAPAADEPPPPPMPPKRTESNAARVVLAEASLPGQARATDATATAPSAAVVARPDAVQPTLPAIDPGLLTNFIFDRGVRRADGSFFVPKPLQRLFEMRTERVAAAEVPVTITLAGRIVPDPQAHGDVEASVPGRIEPPPTGLPVLGETVRKGQILGYVLPLVGVVDRTQVRRDVARLTTDIRIEAENLEILKQFTFVPFRDGKIYQAEQRLAGLQRERQVLLPLLQTEEALHASTDGVISTSSAVSGRIVHAGEMVFEIVDPRRLWVEAAAPDPAIADNAAHVLRASATTPEGQSLALSFVGSGLALQQQSTPVLFRIDTPPDGLRIGRPVTVVVQSENHLQRGIPVRRDSLSIGPDGVQEVWEQVDAEVFVPHVVRTQDIDGRMVLVLDGLASGARVAVTGVRLLAQLQ